MTSAKEHTLFEKSHFNSHAHVERDLLIIDWHMIAANFNSHAHVERDQSKFYDSKVTYISTHTLTWSVTPFHTRIQRFLVHFNSHAHVERDDFDNIRPLALKISTHTLTWSVTLDVVYIWCLLNVMRTYFFI